MALAVLFLHHTAVTAAQTTHRAVPSALALTKQLPLALKATSSTSSLWPVFTDRQRPLRTSHSRADASIEPLSTKLPAMQQHAQQRMEVP
jgi:hypothetical protein